MSFVHPSPSGLKDSGSTNSNQLTIMYHVCDCNPASSKSEHLVTLKPVYERIRATGAPLKQMKSFLGLVQIYSQFLKELSVVAAPLHEVTRTGIHLFWSNETEIRFSNIKQTVTNSTRLMHYDSTLPLFLARDVSLYGTEEVLSQMDEGFERSLAFLSRKLSKA
nr:uncharacterized protein LOC121132099 [Lepeophtheirus salmonis]